MATQFNIQIDLSARLKHLAPNTLLGPPLQRFFHGVTRDFRDVAASRAPKDRGVLQRDHVARVQSGTFPQWGEVRVESPTAIFVHNGTKPHWAPVGALRGWAQRHGINPFALQRSIARKGTKPNPWFEKAVEQDAPRVIDSHVKSLLVDVHQQWGP
jgi:hypothetical protein